MSAERKGTGGGMSGVVALTIVFVVLKLTGTIGWSWIWVLSPVWIACGVGFLLIIFSVILSAMVKK